jgi:hypothetical protein
MKSKSVLWWLGLIVVIITPIICYCSCTSGISIGKSNRVEQTVTNMVDSTVTSFSIVPNK